MHPNQLVTVARLRERLVASPSQSIPDVPVIPHANRLVAERRKLSLFFQLIADHEIT